MCNNFLIDLQVRETLFDFLLLHEFTRNFLNFIRYEQVFFEALPVDRSAEPSRPERYIHVPFLCINNIAVS